ncbi:hypothetical protein P7K49_017700 [Saguinus oedipus]|uniref:Uncharacterized protein n=1 Tax=Saguinus oedipus TaxID=9490 RepID=A0ABQ9V394_SAGOE|nr:hypothetical protein P7K49_017700 [Saguinus oedipus]
MILERGGRRKQPDCLAGKKSAQDVQAKPEHVIGANPSIVDVLQYEHPSAEPHDGVFIHLKLAHNYADDAAGLD